MDKDELCVIRLRDCFTAGYTLPQYCIDNGIKKPLFVSEEKFLQFMWEIYVQFRYDKRMLAQFAFLDLPSGSVTFSPRNTIRQLEYKNFSEINPADFDSIILLSFKKLDVTNKIIPLNTLESYFVSKTYAEIPLLKFLQRYPKVKAFYTSFPLLSRYKDCKEFRKTITDNVSVLRKIEAGKGKGHVSTFAEDIQSRNKKINRCFSG